MDWDHPKSPTALVYLAKSLNSKHWNFQNNWWVDFRSISNIGRSLLINSSLLFSGIRQVQWYEKWIWRVFRSKCEEPWCTTRFQNFNLWILWQRYPSKNLLVCSHKKNNFILDSEKVPSVRDMMNPLIITSLPQEFLHHSDLSRAIRVWLPWNKTYDACYNIDKNTSLRGLQTCLEKFF